MIEKRCPRCNETKSIDDFGTTRRKYASGVRVRPQAYCKACRVAKQTAWDRANPEKLRDLRRRVKLRKNYGITPDQHAAQLATQGGLCAICGRKLDGLSRQTVHVDHCHGTGQLRGILCGSCNTGLGNFRDSESNLIAAIEYLRAGGVWAVEIAA